MQGSASGLSEDVLVLGGSIKVGDGDEIDAKGKTLGEIASEISAQGFVTAAIEDGKFTLRSENGEVNIEASGDFARVSGMGSYTVSSSSQSSTPATNVTLQQGASTGHCSGVYSH